MRVCCYRWFQKDKNDLYKLQVWESPWLCNDCYTFFEQYNINLKYYVYIIKLFFLNQIYVLGYIENLENV